MQITTWLYGATFCKSHLLTVGMMVYICSCENALITPHHLLVTFLGTMHMYCVLFDMLCHFLSWYCQWFDNMCVEVWFIMLQCQLAYYVLFFQQ